jgi:hypothetical protein
MNKAVGFDAMDKFGGRLKDEHRTSNIQRRMGKDEQTDM